MKQGQAQSSMVGSTKVEPMSKAVNPHYPGDLGMQVVRTGGPQQMYEGRGLEAPMKSQATHKGGSQGKY
jgi:hypothetical protein